MTNAPLASLADQFAFNDKAVGMFSGGFEGDDWLHRGDGRSNHALWALGHITHYRRWMARELFGEDVPNVLGARFAMGSTIDDELTSTTPEGLREMFVEAGDMVRGKLRTLDATALDVVLPEDPGMPDGSKTVGGVASFLFFHEAMHIGQIGLLRRCMGKDGLF